MTPSTIAIISKIPCQLKCTFCVRGHDVKYDNDQHDMDTFISSVRWAATAGVHRFDITPIVGESMLDPLFCDKVRHLEDNCGVDKFIVYTNLLALSDEILQVLSKLSKLRLVVSVYGYNEAQYNEVTQTDGNYNKFKTAVESLAKLGLDLVFANRAVQQPGEMLELIDSIDAVVEDPLDSGLIPSTNWCGLVDEGVEVKRQGVCSLLPNITGIYPSGDIVLCGCHDINKQTVIGNIYEQTFDRVYGPRTLFSNIIKLQEQSYYMGSCKDCNNNGGNLWI